MTSTMECLTTESTQLGKSEVPFSVVLEEGIQDRRLSGKAKFTIVNTLGSLWCHKREGKFIFVYFFKCLLLRECTRVSKGGAEREGDTESEAGSRLRAVGTEPDAGSDPRTARP